MVKTIGLALVALLAVGIFAVKARPGSPASSAAPAPIGAVQPPTASLAGPSVVLTDPLIPTVMGWADL